MNIREAADFYRALGWYPIPLKHGTKECRDKDWKERVYEANEFDPADNIGIRLVKESDTRKKKLVSVDLDSSETVELAGRFLPATQAMWGRESKPISQVLYLSSFEKPIVFKDIETGKTLVEIRVDHQSMAPPSTHPNGEPLQWIVDTPWGSIGAVEKISAPEIVPTDLVRAVRMLATASLIARYYNPPGNRHEWCLALAGTLRHYDLSEDETNSIIEGAARLAKDDKFKDRLIEVHSTYQRSDDDPIAGSSKLGEFMDTAKTFVESLRKIWGDRKSEFATSEKGKIIPTSQDNIRKALEKMEVTLSFDSFSRRALITREKNPRTFMNDAALLRLKFDIDNRFHFMPSKELYSDLLETIARENEFHPVLDYLQSLKWDGKPRINFWLVNYGGAASTPLTREISRLVLIAAVRRVVTPGIKFDELLVMESKEQGIGKSSILRALCPTDEWFSDDLPLNVDARQTMERTAGKWIIEAAELGGMRKAHSEHLKAFLSRQVDGPARGAYAHLPDEIPRQFIIIGTTNSSEYLKDTENRRFWPVTVTKFDIEAVKADRDQIWAEAWSRREESIRMDQKYWSHAQLEQDARRETHPWEDQFSIEFGGIGGPDVSEDNEAMWARVGLRSPSDRTAQHKRDLTDSLAKLGITKQVVWDKDTRKAQRKWVRSKSIQQHFEEEKE